MTDTTGKHLETEQKYDAAADFILPDLSGLEGRAKATGRKRYYLSATYFDTEELDLIKNRITLRRRVGGPDEGWHLKLPVRKDTRQEVRTPLSEGDTGSVPARLAAQVQDVIGSRPCTRSPFLIPNGPWSPSPVRRASLWPKSPTIW